MLKGGISWKEELREVITEATKKSRTLDKFKEYLEKCYGVKITRDGKDFSYLHPEKQKPIRREKLGTNYSKSAVWNVSQEVKEENQKFSKDLNQTLEKISETVTDIERQVSTATAKATDEAVRVMKQSINKMADNAVIAVTKVPER